MSNTNRIILLLQLVLIVSCNDNDIKGTPDTITQNVDSAVDNIAVYTLEESISEDIFRKKTTKELWFHSWPWENQSLYRANFERTAIDTFSLLWQPITDDQFEYMKPFFDIFLVFNDGGVYAIDRYFYDSYFEKSGDSVKAGFGPHTKINLIDTNEHTSAEVMWASPDDIIEDAIWISKSEFLLLGFNNDSLLYPFIFYYNIDKKITKRYEYTKPFNGDRESYFDKKFPNIIY